MNTYEQDTIHKGSVDYHNRVDFRAFDVMVQALDNATLPELKVALGYCKEYGNDLRVSGSKRMIWRAMGTLIRKIAK